MSGGSSPPAPPTTSTVVQQANMPPFLQAADQQVIDQARQVTGTQFQPYTGGPGPGGAAVAPLTAEQNSGIAQIQSNTGSYRPGFDTAGAVFGSVAGGNTGLTDINAPTVNTQQVNGAPLTADEISRYRNPYQGAVLDTTMDAINRESQIQEAGNQRMAGMNNAYGGSGSAVLTGINNENTMRQVAQTAAQLEAQGYDKATAMAEADRQARMGAATSNNSTEIQKGQLGLSAEQAQAAQEQARLQAELGAATSAETLGMNTQSAGLNDANAALTAGKLQQDNGQAVADFNFNQFQNQVQYPYLQTQRLADIVQGVRAPTSTTGSTVTQGPGPAIGSQLAGLGLGAAGIAQAFKRKGGRIGTLPSFHPAMARRPAASTLPRMR